MTRIIAPTTTPTPTAARPTLPVTTRWMVPRDMEAALAIEAHTPGVRWSRADFDREFRRRNVVGMVAETGPGDIVGVLAYELHRTEISVLRLAVHPSARLMGVGRRLVGHVRGKLRKPDMGWTPRTSAVLHVPESNLDVQLFLRATGWRCVAVDRTCGEWDLEFRLRAGAGEGR